MHTAQGWELEAAPTATRNWSKGRSTESYAVIRDVLLTISIPDRARKRTGLLGHHMWLRHSCGLLTPALARIVAQASGILW